METYSTYMIGVNQVSKNAKYMVIEQGLGFSALCTAEFFVGCFPGVQQVLSLLHMAVGLRFTRYPNSLTTIRDEQSKPNVNGVK